MSFYSSIEAKCDEDEREAGKKLRISCFIFNLIAIEDKAQIQTFPHIKALRRRFHVVYKVPMMKKGKNPLLCFYLSLGSAPRMQI